MIVRSKPGWISKHAWEGMLSERSPITTAEVERVLEDPDHDDGRKAQRWIRKRTIFVYYHEEEGGIEILAVSATKRRMAPPVPKPPEAPADD